MPNTLNEYANGYLASCESNFLRISVDRIRSLTARINVAVPRELFLNSGGKTDHLRRPFISVYYKPTKTRNETYLDTTRSHKWLRVVEKANYNPVPHSGSFTMSAQLSSLLGDQTYAVYASLTSNFNTVGLFSPIDYFQTLRRQPEPVLNLRGESLSGSSVKLTWQPPSKPNGPILTYLIYYGAMEDRLPVNSSKLLCLMKDRWDSEVTMPMNDININTTNQCIRSSSKITQRINNADEEIEEDPDRNGGVDQAVTDLSILEYQLINSVSQRKDPLVIRQEVKDTIINDLDIYFEDKSSSFNEQYKPDSEEQPLVEHKPHVVEHNVSVPTTFILIEGLKEAQLYLFQVYACHDTSKLTLAEACSLNGVNLAIRTKPGNRKFFYSNDFLVH